MICEDGIYMLVYEYYEAKILSGLYNYGDDLPSIAKICDMFNMAPATVRSALKLLKSRGFIQIDDRKAAKVVYRADFEDNLEDAAHYFMERKDGILDVCKSGSLLMEPVLELGMSRLSQEDWDNFSQKAKINAPDALAMPVQLCIAALNTLNCKLIVNLYWEIVRYLRFPYLSARKMDEEQEDASMVEDYRGYMQNKLRSQFASRFDDALKYLAEFVGCSSEEIDNISQIPFKWNVYRQRPQICYSLISHVIYTIACGNVAIGDCLLSLPKMARQYGVSVSTVRRAVAILNSLGVTRSFQGQGTVVCMEVRGIDFSVPAVKAGLRMHLDGLRMLALTIKNVSAFVLQSSSDDEIENLQESFSCWMMQGKSYRLFQTFLLFIVNNCSLAMIRECYSQLHELLMWGYPLVVYRLDGTTLNDMYSDVGQKMCVYLRQRQWSELSEALKLLMESEEREVRELLAKRHIADDEHMDK